MVTRGGVVRRRPRLWVDLTYRVLHLRANSLNLLEERATGEKVTSRTVYSVAKLVFIQKVHTEAIQKHPWNWD